MKFSNHLLYILGWGTILLYIFAPPSAIFGLPDNIFIADLLWLIILYVLILFIRNDEIKIDKTSEVIYLFVLYIFLILLLPLFGIIIFDYSLNVYLGDLRWVQVLSLFLLFIAMYKYAARGVFEKHVIYFFRVLILTQVPFLLFQINFAVLGGAPGFLLELWYPGGESRYGFYGVHMFRFSGSFGAPSSLSLISGIVFLISGLKLYLKPNRVDLLFLFLSLILMISAGGRTTMIGVPILFICIVLFLVIKRLHIKKSLLNYLLLTSILLVGILYTLIYYNIGRIASGDRVVNTFRLLVDITTFYEVTGRGGDRWYRPIFEAFQNYSSFGTLANSSNVLNHLPAFDNYFIYLIAQAGAIIVIPFLLLVSYLLYQGLYLFNKKDSIGAVIFSVSIILLIYSFTSNLLTGLPARYLLLIAVLLTYFSKAKKRDRI